MNQPLFFIYNEKKKIEAIRMEWLQYRIQERSKETVALQGCMYEHDTETVIVSWSSSSRGVERMSISSLEILNQLIKKSIPRSMITVGELEEAIADLVSNKVNFMITAPSA